MPALRCPAGLRSPRSLRCSRALPPLSVALALVPACLSPQPLGEAPLGDPERLAAEAVIDDWHAAASEADAERYLGHLAPDAVFLGTDARERWTREEFAAYVREHFSRGRGWAYEPVARHVYVGPEGHSAWFDERLWNDNYGEMRGTGVLRKLPGGWKVALYDLGFVIPNEVAGEVVELVRRRREDTEQ